MSDVSDAAFLGAKGGSNFTETTIHYIQTNQPSSKPAHATGAVDRMSASAAAAAAADAALRASPPTPAYAYSSTSVAAPPMYVRALYDYEADDRTSLSFHQGDIIQVLTQLDSGWWDGVINNVRGWFPSNYCALVTPAPAPADPPHPRDHPHAARDPDEPELLVEEDTDSESYDNYSLNSDGNIRHASPHARPDAADGLEQEEAAFWIPQATPDGRLYYFNTLTGVSTMELPLETPSSATESGPRDRTNVHVPEQMPRPPPEQLASGAYELNELAHAYDPDESNSASEREGESMAMASRFHSALRKKRSHFSDGVSPAPSLDSLNELSPTAKGKLDSHDIYLSSISMSAAPPMGTTTTSFTSNPLEPTAAATMPRSFFDDGSAAPLTWNRLVENMRSCVDRYRQAITDGDRSEYVRKAEDISDHIRLILAAGSGTTDNHSGNPSIISTNKALYPHFRDMMSKLSKLVLSSHIAAADWPARDTYTKCLLEAENVLHGVYSYVEVARQQRGEDIPRLLPGFVIGSGVGGNWQNNGLGARDPMSSAFMDQDDYDPALEPTARLDAKLLEALDELKRPIVAHIRRLEEHLVVRDNLITARKHELIGDAICIAAGKVIECLRPWIATIESINLHPLGSTLQNPQLVDFSGEKQRFYDLVSDLLLSCQAVTGPLADEWSAVRGEPLEERLLHVKGASRQLEICTSQLGFSLQLLLEQVQMRQPQSEQPQRAEAHANPPPHPAVPQRGTSVQRGTPTADGLAQSFPDALDPAKVNYGKGDNSKVLRFFGAEPGPAIPSFLLLDHENEISYNTKVVPPQLQGGTLLALVEQLTRHDRLDSSFNNTFLLTYRSFTTASELFDILVKRFSIQPPPGLAGVEDYQTWVDRKQKPIRFRVVNILKSWFDAYWMEGQDEEAKRLIRRVFEFARDAVATTSTPGAQQLMAVLEQRLKGQETTTKRMVLTINTATPTPIIPRNMKKLKFSDIDVTEFARQLTIIESRLYGKIKPTECLNKTWQKKTEDGKEPASNVKALILHSNQLTNWVAEMILTQHDVRKRVVVIKHFVSVADKCRNLNNFSTLTSIISALGTAPVHRLKRTWDQVPRETKKILEQMRLLMKSSPNFHKYRETLNLANPPCIPFFGVYLTDLVFIEDGIPSVIKKTQLINFAKRAKTAEVIRNIQQYQNVPYPLQPVTELQDYILSNMQAAGDVHEMYERSLQVEPREREDEKIARYKTPAPASSWSAARV
ncbi:MAG: hypothetical protein M1829_002851 [Trizodia sp. TS-e1964]|nr:MAG: hypothetical protein M1829_002851 [Trizodia sp. TS-e1964]